MLSSGRRSRCVMAVAVLAVLCMAGPGLSVEDGLMDVRIGASYREVLRRLGHSTGILFSSGGTVMYQTLPTGGGAAGLPVFAPQTTAGPPVWVLPLRTTQLADAQSEWVYDLRGSKGVALGIILTGEGADAAVTDVVVAGFAQNLKGKPQPVRTEKGVVLQSTFSDILDRYGYPPLIEIYAPTGTVGGAGAARAGGGGQTARGGAMRAGAGGGRAGAGGGGRAGAGGGGGRGGRMRGASLTGTGSTELAAIPSYRVALTGAGARGDGGRGGRRAGAGGGGGGGGGQAARGGGGRVSRGGGQAGLPPLGSSALPGLAAGALTAQSVVNGQSIGFARDCILVYEGIAFTLHDMRVVRIHVSE